MGMIGEWKRGYRDRKWKGNGVRGRKGRRERRGEKGG